MPRKIFFPNLDLHYTRCHRADSYPELITNGSLCCWKNLRNLLYSPNLQFSNVLMETAESYTFVAEGLLLRKQFFPVDTRHHVSTGKSM